MLLLTLAICVIIVSICILEISRWDSWGKRKHNAMRTNSNKQCRRQSFVQVSCIHRAPGGIDCRNRTVAASTGLLIPVKQKQIRINSNLRREYDENTTRMDYERLVRILNEFQPAGRSSERPKRR